MAWIQATLAFYPKQKNPARHPGGRGVWRVVGCSRVSNALKTRVGDLLSGQRVLRMMVARAYKTRSRVDPVKLAMEFAYSNKEVA